MEVTHWQKTWCKLSIQKQKNFLYYVIPFADSLSTTFGKIQNLDSDKRVLLCQLLTHTLSPSLGSQWDASSVGDLALLQVFDQLSQPALCGCVVLQHLGKGAIFQLIWQTLTQGFSGSEIV